MARIIDIQQWFVTDPLEAKLKSLRGEAEKTSDKFNKLINEIKASNDVLQRNTKTQSNVTKALKRTNKQTDQLTATEKELIRIKKAGEKVSVETAKAQLQLTKRRREAREEAKKQLGITQKQIPFTQRMAGAFRAAAIQIAAAYAAIRGIVVGITKYIKLNQEVNRQTSQTAATFGLARDQARELTTEIRATATAFEKEYTDVLRSANIISKEFGITGSEALALINEGFEKGADVNGEFLELLKEYPAQLRSVGLDAEQTIAIITQTERAGVFSDKGIDAIKEAGLRLRELTPATREALDMIGLSSEEIERSLADGSKTLFEVTQDVSAQLATLPPQSAAVGTAIADIFGGPGEDAGLRFLTTLKDINTDLSEIETTLSKDEQASIRLRRVWEELRTSSVGSGGFIAAVKNGLADLLTSVLEFRRGFVAGWNDLIMKSNEFRAGISVLGNAVKLNFQLMIQSVLLAVEPFLTLGRAIKAVLQRDWDALKNTIPQAFENVKNRVNNMKDAVVDAGTSIRDAFTGENIDRFTIKVEGATNKVQAFKSQYQELNEQIISSGREQIDMNLLEIETLSEVTGRKISEEQRLFNERAKLQERLTEKVEEEEEKRFLTTQEKYGAVSDLANATFDYLTSLRDAEMQQIAEKEAYELSLVGDNEQAQQRIRQKFDRQRAELERRQAISDKAQALFNAAINTAQAITAALTIPPPAGPILAAVNGVLGGIQIAAISAKPIPQFKEGTGPGGLPADMWAEFGEAGAEIVHEPGKTPYIADKPTIGYLPKGTEIIPNWETEKILAGHGGISAAKMDEFISEQRATRRALQNQTHHHASLTEDGIQYQTRKGNTTIKWVNKYMNR